MLSQARRHVDFLASVLKVALAMTSKAAILNWLMCIIMQRIQRWNRPIQCSVYRGFAVQWIARTTDLSPEAFPRKSVYCRRSW